MTGRMPTYASRPRRATALAALASALFAALAIALATPGYAHAYEYWYRVYDEDMNLLWDSRDPDAEVPEMDVNDLMRGIYIEGFYDGSDGDPIPSDDTGFAYEVIATSEDGSWRRVSKGLDAYELDDARRYVYDERGLACPIRDENGIYCGISHSMMHGTITSVPPNSQLSIVVSLSTYWHGGGGDAHRPEKVTIGLNVNNGDSEDPEETGEGEEPDDTEGEIVEEELIVGNDPDEEDAEADPITGVDSEEEPEEDGAAEGGGDPGETENPQSEERSDGESGAGEEPEESEVTDDADEFEPSEDESADEPADDEWAAVQPEGSAGREDASESANRDPDGSDDVAGANQEKTPSDAWEPVGNVREDDDPAESSRKGDVSQSDEEFSEISPQGSRTADAEGDAGAETSASETSRQAQPSSPDAAGEEAGSSGNRQADEGSAPSAGGASLADLGTVFALADNRAPAQPSTAGPVSAQVRLTGLSAGYVMLICLFALAFPVGGFSRIARRHAGASGASRLG